MSVLGFVEWQNYLVMQFGSSFPFFRIWCRSYVPGIRRTLWVCNHAKHGI